MAHVLTLFMSFATPDTMLQYEINENGVLITKYLVLRDVSDIFKVPLNSPKVGIGHELLDRLMLHEFGS